MIQTTKVAHRTIKARDLDIFYREAGPKDAPAVLLLHGFPTSSQMFRNLIPALADRYHVLAPDYPGFGHNSMPPRDEFAYTFDNLAGVVEEFTAMLGRTAQRSRFPFQQGVAMATMPENRLDRAPR
jgi:pimeloyl-ACP methyl ester carboxylesterase